MFDFEIRILLASILCIVSLYISYNDVRYRRISNYSCVIVLVLCVLIKNDSLANIVNPFYIVILGSVFFLLRLLGGGDIKLVAAFSIAIDSQYHILVILIVLFLGGGAGLIQLVWNKTKRKNDGVPYGVPICIGSLFGVFVSVLG